MSDQSDAPTEAPVLPEGDTPRLPARPGSIFGAVGAVDRAKRAVERERRAGAVPVNGSAAEATAALFDQDAEGAGVDDSTPESEAPAEEPTESAPDEPAPTEVILTRMAEIIADPDGMDEQLRNNKLHDIRVEAALLPEDELGKFCAFVVANGDQFDARTLHYVVKQLLTRHPKVTEQDPSLPGNVLGGVARRVIEGDYTWDNLVIHPPRPKPEPSEEPPVAEGSSDRGDDGSIDEITPVNSEDPILARLRQQNAELAALGF